MTDFSGNVSFFTEDFYKLVQPYNPLVQEVASELNRFSYERIESLLQAMVGRLTTLFDFDTDENIWGKEDYWACPDEMVEVGAGDCDDFALFASSTLNALGIEHDLVMGYYYGGGGHAWVEVHEGPSTYIVEFSQPQLYIVPVGDYSFTPYMPVERVGVS